MGLLDEAIREHLELKRRRGADAGELSRAESEALGPVRRTPDGTPDLASLPPAPPPGQPDAEPHPGEHPPGFDVEPDWAEETAVLPATPALPADDPDKTVAWRAPTPDTPAPVTPPPAFRNEPAPRPQGFEPLAPRSAASSPSPPASPLPEHEPPPAAHEPEPPAADEPPPAKSRFGAASRLRLRRGGASEERPAIAPSERVESFHSDPPPSTPPESSPAYEPPAPPPAAYEPPPPPPAYQPPRPVYEPPPPPPAYEPPPPTRAYEPPPPPAYTPPPPYPPPSSPRDRGDGPAGEDILEETPEFLEETPDHDRLWFEQRPPRDFDFDG